jgi:hypothetical protein
MKTIGVLFLEEVWEIYPGELLVSEKVPWFAIIEEEPRLIFCLN